MWGVRGTQESFPEGDRTCSESTCKERWVQAQMNSYEISMMHQGYTLSLPSVFTGPESKSIH